MTAMTDEERVFGWDEPEIPEPKESSGFVLLTPGNYPFVVVKFERARHEPDPNKKNDNPNPLPACPKAIITVSVDGGEQGTTELKTNLFLHSRCEGMICSFFTALGHRVSGQPLKMEWNRVVGATGVCKIGQKPGYKDKDKTYNEIKAWLEPGTPVTPGAPPVIPFG